jgi:hypothetical protein
MDKYPFLSDLEKELLTALQGNETQREALRKVLLHCVYSQGVVAAGGNHDPKHNWALSFAWRDELSNEQLGADLRAAAQGIAFVERAFNDLQNFEKKPEKVEVKKNPAR